MNKLRILIIIIVLSACLVGCGPRNRIFAINKEDMFRVPVANARIEWDDTDGMPGDLFYTGKPGWFISDDILKQVYDAEAQEDLNPTIWDRMWKGLGL